MSDRALPLKPLARYPATGAAQILAGPAFAIYQVETTVWPTKDNFNVGPTVAALAALEAIRGGRLTRAVAPGVYVMVTPEDGGRGSRGGG